MGEVTCSMGAGEQRAASAHGSLGVRAAWLAPALVLVLAVLAGCDRNPAPAAPAAGQTLAPLRPTVTPAAVPALGPLRFGAFESTWSGSKALQVCEVWARLRGAYAARVLSGTSPEPLEQWFSSAVWQPAFAAAGPLQTNPGYTQISTAFFVATIGSAASIAQGKRLDAACSAAD